MCNRNAERFVEKQRKNMYKLIQEGLSGETKRDYLTNSSYPFIKEAEAAYFRQLRDFSKKSLTNKIINNSQEIYDGEFRK